MIILNVLRNHLTIREGLVLLIVSAILWIPSSADSFSVPSTLSPLIFAFKAAKNSSVGLNWGE